MTSVAGQAQCIAGVAEVDAAEWNALAGDYPFLRHEFLSALEETGCAAPDTGWTPRHLLLRHEGRLLAAAPLYLKTHSWGEFVFDFAWARAWESLGLPYYPKLLCAIPFTPATGPRLLLRADQDQDALRRRLLSECETLARSENLSGAHALFIDEPLRRAAEAGGWLMRSDCQFQWRNAGYRDFEHYLQGFSADKRKKVRRERRRVTEQGIEFRVLSAAQLDEAELARVHALHAGTFAQRGHLPYLSLACLRRLARTLPESMLVVLALRQARIVATAVFFRSADTLYGRYWGADDLYHSLHFEACYYQGIEYCITHGLARFEPGTQGEHKLTRGFTPTLTWSAHWIGEPRLRAAIAGYLERERRAVAGYAAEAMQHLPFNSHTRVP